MLLDEVINIYTQKKKPKSFLLFSDGSAFKLKLDILTSLFALKMNTPFYHEFQPNLAPNDL